MSRRRAIRKLVAGSYDAILAADPGFGRLRFAGRATLTVALALAVLTLLSGVTGRSFFSFFVGVVVGLVSSVAVNDPDPRQRRLTMVFAPIPAALSLTLAGLLSFSHYLAEAIFVVVMFFAVYLRRFGPRWFAFGMLSFVSYFFAMFLRARLVQLPWMYLAAVIGIGCAYLLRFYLLRDPAHLTLARTLPSIRARLRALLSRFERALRRPSQRERNYRAMRHHAVRLNETALMIVEQPEQTTIGDELFGMELAAQRLMELAREPLEEASRDALLADLAAARTALRGSHTRPSGSLRWRTSPNDPTGRALRRLVDAVVSGAGRHEERGGDEETGSSGQPGSGEEIDREEEPGHGKGADRDDEEPTEERGWDDEEPKGPAPATRQAVQVAVASTVAIAGGELISTRRWYWAALTAFIVFTGTTSRGDVFVKGWQRAVGTLVGVFVGVFVATAVGDSRIASLLLIFLSIFLAFYLFSVSYAAMIFWITILLALLYGMLHFFSVHLLALRLEETVFGSAIGMVVALLILPTRTRVRTRELSQGFLRALVRLLRACRVGGEGGPGDEEIMRRLRELDRAFHDLRQAARPLTVNLPGSVRPRSSEHWLRVLLNLRHEGHTLTRYVRRLIGSGASHQGWVRSVARLEARIEWLAGAIEKGTLKRRALEKAQAGTPDFPGGSAGGAVSAVTSSLRRIDWTITILEEDLGIEEEPQ